MLCNFLYVKKNCDAALKAIAVFCIRLRRTAAQTCLGNKPQLPLFYFTSASYTAVTLAVTLMLPERMPVSQQLLAQWNAWKRLGVLASEMESATLFVVAAALGVRCGAGFHTVWNQERRNAGIQDPDSKDTDTAVRLGIEAMKCLILQDRAGSAL